METLRSVNGVCDSTKLAALEAELRVQFPRRYRSWLLETNGFTAIGMPVFEIPDNPHDTEDIIRDLLGIVPANTNRDIEWHIKSFLWILRQNHLPIGMCDGSNILSIELGTRNEAIYYFEMLDELTEHGLRTPYFVAKNIDEFIASLKA